MKLYIKSGACSLAPHIALREAGLSFELVKVDLATKKLEDGSDYLAINPKGQVPALALDDGTVLTEAAVLLQYIADQAPEAKLLPAGGIDRYKALGWLNFVSTELHKGFGPLFRPNTPEEYKPIVRQTLIDKYTLLDRELAGREYLAPTGFSVADAYCFVTLLWAKFVKLDIGHLANVAAYQARIADRPAVKAALTAEGLA